METILITIKTLKSSEEAYFLKSQLDQFGIDCFFANENMKHIAGTGQKQGILLQVKPNDVEHAIERILDLYKVHGDNLFTQKKREDTKRILVPIDFSEYSLKACQFAIGLAQHLDAEIKLLHIYEDPFDDSVSTKSHTSFQRHMEHALYQTEHKAQDEMIRFSEIFHQKMDSQNVKNLRFHFSMLRGEPEHEIVKMGESYRPEIIVLGTRGQSEKPTDLIGSVTTKVIEKTKIPVLAIPEASLFTSIKQLNILYATDFMDEDFTSFNTLLSILKPYDVKIHCTHIKTDEKKQCKKEEMQKLETKLTENYGDYDVDCHLIEHRNLVDGIQNFIDEKNIDIISFTSPQRSIFYKLLRPNNLKKMIYQSRIPLLIFRY